MNVLSVNTFKKSILFAIIGIVSAVAFVAMGQTDTAPQGSIDAALKDLSAISGQEVSNVTQAKALCDLEKYLSDCATIGKKYELFQADEIKQVDAVLNELKGQILDELKGCTTEECLIGVAGKIAKNLAQRNPAIARGLDLTATKIEEKKVVVSAAKEAGVDIQECRDMDPETAPIELLRACAKLAKNQNVQKVLSKETREAVAGADISIKLREALASGEVQCGDNTPEGCGNFCLNPGANARAGGASSIPPVCREIATKFFGAEGLAHLEQTYGQINQTFEYNKKRAENVVFTTTDGQTLTNPAQIGSYLEEQGKKGNVEAVSKGLDFMIAKGFARPGDKEFVLQMVQQAKDSGGFVDFDRCAQNPEACREFIPQGNRQQFDAFREIEGVMRAEMSSRGVSDPRQCEQSNDPKIGEACLAGAKSALPKIEAIAEKYPQVKFIVQEIKQHISFGDQGLEARKNVEERFKGGQGVTIGGQQFNDFQAIQQFCDKNGQLCLTDAAKEGFIKRDYASQKFEQSFEAQFRNQGNYRGPDGFPGAFGQFPGSPGGFPGGPGGFPQQGGFPSGGQFGGPQFQGPGSPSFNREEALRQFQQWLDNPQGPPPIPNQFDARSHDPFPQQQQFGQNVCPAFPTVNECPSGQRRVVAYSSPQCGVYYRCESDGQTQSVQCQPDQYWNGSTCVRSGGGNCPSNQYWVNQPGGGGYCRYYNTGDNNQSVTPQPCPQGQYWYFSPAGGGYCRSSTGESCPSGQYWNGTACTTSSTETCPQGQYWYVPWGGGSGYCRSTSDSQVNACPSNQFWNGSACVAGEGSSPGTCSDGVDNDNDGYTDGTDFGCGGNQGGNNPPTSSSCDSALTALLGTGCHQMYTDSSGNQVYCDGPMSKSAKRGDTTTMAGCAGGGGNTQSCPSGQYWNGTACVQSTTSGTCDSTLTGLLGSGCHNMGNAWFNGEMTRYVFPNTTAVRECTANWVSGCTTWGSGQNSCPSGQYWNGTACTTSSPGTCPQGQYWYTPPGGGTGYCQSNTTGNWEGSSPGQCSDGIDNDNDNLIDGADSSCSSSPTSSSCDSALTALLGTGCHQMYTDSSGNQVYCDGPMSKSAKRGDTTTMAGCAGGGGNTQSCPSGQYWNGTACTTSSTGSCPSGQYWNGNSCVTSTTGTTACSDGRDNDGDGQIDYPADTGCYGPSDPDEIIPPTSGSTCPSFAHEMGGFCMLNSNTALCASYSSASSESNYTSSQCGGGTTSGSCPSGQYWNGSSCVTSSTSGSCPSGQYWNGSACVTSSTGSCPSGQYWYYPTGGGAGYCVSNTSPPPTSSSCPSGQHWYTPSSGAAYCVSDTSPPPTTTTCSSGQYWNGSACVSSATTPPPSSTSCSGGQYWSGSSCVCSSGTSWNGSSCVSACSSGQYWNGTSCVSSTTTPPPTTPPPTTTSCPSGYHLEGSTCYPDSTTPPPTTPPPSTTPPPTTTPPPSPTPSPTPPPTSFFFRSSNCPSNHLWNGSYCVVRPQYTAHLYAQAVTSFRNIADFVLDLFR